MLGFISKMFGGSKSEKDIKTIEPVVGEINRHFASFQGLSNDELRGKTVEFRARIKNHLKEIDDQIASLTKNAEELPFSEIAT
jgi:preprotein translocase subunit SecA